MTAKSRPVDGEARNLFTRIEIKAIDEEKRIIEGLATTPDVDLVDDIVEPMGAEFKLPIPLLLNHDHSLPVGEVFSARKTKDGIYFKARIPKFDEPGRIKERLDEAWHSLKAGLIKAVSIGFTSIERSIMDSGGYRFVRWLWHELSLVAIPANPNASITAIKSFDRELRAVSGNQQSVQWLNPARARAPQKLKRSNSEGDNVMTKTIAEQIAAWEAELDSVDAKRKAIQSKALEEGRTKDENEQEQFDDLSARSKAVKKEIEDLRSLEVSKAETATPVTKVEKSADAAGNRSGLEPRGRTTVLGPNKNIPQGIPFARMVMCLAAAKGNEFAAAEIARKVYHDDARISKYLEIKAAVPAAYTGDAGGWAEDIAEPRTISTEFIEFLRPNNIVDSLASQMTRVPFNVKVARDTAAMGGYWVGENLPIPMTSTVYDTVTMGKTKVGSIAAMTKEQMKFSNISAEMAIRNNLAGAVNAKMDTTFVSTTAASAGVSPAGLLNGLSAIASAGDTADNARTDLVNLYEPFSTANISRNRLVYVTTENIAYALRIMKSTLGVYDFPEVRDGNLDGRPFISSNHVSGGDLIAISAPDILLADDGEISVELSDQASLEMLNASLVQDGTAGTGTSLWSTWQNEAVAIKITRYVNWQKGRSAAVAYIGDATYQGAATA